MACRTEGVARDGRWKGSSLPCIRSLERKLPAALELYRKLSERGQATAQSRSVEAMIHEAQDPPDVYGAIDAWRSTMELDAQNWGAAKNLSNLLMRTPAIPNAEEQVYEVLEEALRRAPQQPEPRLNLAVVSAMLGDKTRAKELARELVGLGASLDRSMREQAERLLKQFG